MSIGRQRVEKKREKQYSNEENWLGEFPSARLAILPPAFVVEIRVKVERISAYSFDFTWFLDF